MAVDVVIRPRGEIQWGMGEFKELTKSLGLAYGYLTEEWTLIDFDHDEIEEFTLVVYDPKRVNRGFTIYTEAGVEYIHLSQPIPATAYDVQNLFAFTEAFCKKYGIDTVYPDDEEISLAQFMASKNNIANSHRQVVADMTRNRQENLCIIGAKKPVMICNYYDELGAVLEKDNLVYTPGTTYKIVFDEEDASADLMETYARILHEAQE